MAGNDWDNLSMDNQTDEKLDKVKSEEEAASDCADRQTSSASGSASSKEQHLRMIVEALKKVKRPPKKAQKPLKKVVKPRGKKKSTETETGILIS